MTPQFDRPLDLARIRSAHVPVPCTELSPMLDFFVQRLGFRIDAIFPADAPATAIVSGHGVTLCLERSDQPGPAELRLLCDDPDAVAEGVREWRAPSGLAVRLVDADPPMKQPPTRQELCVSRSGDGEPWSIGRAGLRYRDLLPGRHGGAFIASHIRILDGGPVPDYVHFHKVRFQTIFCRKGWVRVVYEGQGDPFEMHAGDCVLQPPMIRHRVLESSAGAEVVELASPAQHVTMADHAMTLPSLSLPPGHDFNGQRFVRHIAQGAHWQPWRVPGFEARDTGIAAATGGLAAVRVVRALNPQAGHEACAQRHASELCFYFVLQGQLELRLDDDKLIALACDDSVTLPSDAIYTLRPSADLQLLEVMLPAAPSLWQAPQRAAAD